MMDKVQEKAQGPEKKTFFTPKRKHRIRLAIGCTLIALVAAFALIVTVTMRQRIDAAEGAAKAQLQRGLQNNLIVFAGLLIVAIGITFDLFTASRRIAVRILGYAIWGIGVLITTEALLMCGQVAIQISERDAAADAPYVVVLGTPLMENNAAPVDLSARLGTASGWWRDHRDATLVVTGRGTASKSSGGRLAQYAPTSYEQSNKSKSEVDAIASLLADYMVPVLREEAKKAEAEAGKVEETPKDEALDESAEAEEEKKEKEKYKTRAEAMIVKVGQSDSTEQALLNLLKTKGIEADTPIIVVTNNYDMRQAMLAAEKAGFTNVTRLPAPAGFWEFGANILWETWSVYDPAIVQAEESGT